MKSGRVEGPTAPSPWRYEIRKATSEALRQRVVHAQRGEARLILSDQFLSVHLDARGIPVGATCECRS
jgi:hypothetical protein